MTAPKSIAQFWTIFGKQKSEFERRLDEKDAQITALTTRVDELEQGI